MITIIKDIPAHVAGFTASGTITKNEYEEVIICEIENKLKKHRHIHFLLVLETGITDFTLGAWWSDVSLGLTHFLQWKKIAIVTDREAVIKFTKVFSALVPGKSRGFSFEELEIAKTWVAAEN